MCCICNLIDHTGKQQARECYSRSAWERGRIPAVHCPSRVAAPARGFRERGGMLLWFGSGWAANCSDAFLISCPVAASYLRSCAKEDATFEDVLIVFLLFSFKGKKKSSVGPKRRKLCVQQKVCYTDSILGFYRGSKSLEIAT